MEFFISFLDTLAHTNGEELRFQNLSNDSEVPARTIQNYVQILEDTLLGFQLKPFRKTKKRKAIACSKFYFFDLGVVNSLANRPKIEEYIVVSNDPISREIDGIKLYHWKEFFKIFLDPGY